MLASVEVLLSPGRIVLGSRPPRNPAWLSRLILLCAFVAAAVAVGVSVLQENKYEANASLLFRDPGFDESLLGGPTFGAQDATREAATNVELVSLQVIADTTAKELPEGTTGADVARQISIDAEGQADLVTITASGADPNDAANLANAFAVRIIVVELHNLDGIQYPPFNAVVASTLSKLRTDFSVVHIHPNNIGGWVRMGGVRVPRLLEAVFLRDDHLRAKYPRPALAPHPLDQPNDPSLPDVAVDDFFLQR